MNRAWPKAIIFDFDGVIAESNDARTTGFEQVLRHEGFPKPIIRRFIAYHKKNGGLSRYSKFRYLYRVLLKKPLSARQLQHLCQSYSRLVKGEVTRAPWVRGAQAFLRRYASQYQLFVVSGSDGKELRSICRARGISQYLRKILGSPVEKAENIRGLLKAYRLSGMNSLFVGDTINDWTAAQANGVPFLMRDSGHGGAWSRRVDRIRDLRDLPRYLRRRK